MFFGTGFGEKFGFFKEILNNFNLFVSNFINSTILYFQGIIDFLTGVFTGDWQLAFTGLENILEGFYGMVDSIFSFIKNVLDSFLIWISNIFLTDWSIYLGRGGDILNRIFCNYIRNYRFY